MAAFWTLALVLLAGSICSGYKLGSRITGGDPAAIEDYPSIVQVQRVSGLGSTWTLWCGGSIINNVFILSSALCFGEGENTRTLRIRAGAERSGINSPGTIVYISQWYNHPSFGSNGYDGDLSVVRLATTLTYTTNINAVPIIRQDAVLPANLPVMYAGYGYLRDSPLNPNYVLRNVSTVIVDTALCRWNYLNSDQPEPDYVTDNMICAGGDGRGHCTDDEGGPLYYDGILVGIISWGWGCGDPRYPGVNTKIASYTDWIIRTAV